MSPGDDRADEDARMELPGSGVHEDGVHQRGQAFEPMSTPNIARNSTDPRRGVHRGQRRRSASTGRDITAFTRHRHHHPAFCLRPRTTEFRENVPPTKRASPEGPEKQPTWRPSASTLLRQRFRNPSGTSSPHRRPRATEGPRGRFADDHQS